jgi:hypothetical protein
VSRVSMLKGGGPLCGCQTQAWSALPRVGSNTGVAGASWQPQHPPCSTGVLLPPYLCLCCQQCITVGSRMPGGRASTKGIPSRALGLAPTTPHYINIHMYMYIVSIYIYICKCSMVYIAGMHTYLHICVYIHMCAVGIYIYIYKAKQRVQSTMSVSVFSQYDGLRYVRKVGCVLHMKIE